VLRFLDASPSRPGHQVFGSRFQGLPTGNDAAVADGVYRITLADNIQLGSFSLATQQLATAQQLRLARFNTLAVQKNNYYYFAPLHGYRNAATPGDGDDFLLGKAIANVGLSRDLLSGMGGNDFLNGYGNRFDPSLDFNATTNPLSAFGRNQRDVLTGGAGRDVFQLADAIGVFYRGDAAQGFAQITDFSAEDVLILSGSPAQYTLTAPLTAQQSPVGIAGRALYAGDPKTGGDLIAVLQGVGSAAFQLGSAANPSSQVHWL
jgi:hypothetical protein